MLAGVGLDLHRAVLADWVGRAAFHLKPIVARLAEHLKRSSKLFLDETTAQVLDPGRGVTKTWYLWALARDDRPLCGEGRTRCGDHTVEAYCPLIAIVKANLFRADRPLPPRDAGLLSFDISCEEGRRIAPIVQVF